MLKMLLYQIDGPLINANGTNNINNMHTEDLIHARFFFVSQLPDLNTMMITRIPTFCSFQKWIHFPDFRPQKFQFRTMSVKILLI